MKSHVEQRESMQQQAEPEMHDSSDAALYDRYARIILAYVRLHTDLREDPEDLTLEVFLAALERDNLTALVGQLAIVYPLTMEAPEPPKRRRRARSRRRRRLPFHTNGVGFLFHPFTVCSNQSMTCWAFWGC